MGHISANIIIENRSDIILKGKGFLEPDKIRKVEIKADVWSNFTHSNQRAKSPIHGEPVQKKQIMHQGKLIDFIGEMKTKDFFNFLNLRIRNNTNCLQ